MELHEFLDKVDRRKKDISLYKIYNISSRTGSDLREPLELNLAQDVFGVSPRAALEYEVQFNPNGYGLLLANDIIQSIQTNDENFFKFFNVLPDEEKKDYYKVTSKEYPHATVTTTTMTPPPDMPAPEWNHNIMAVLDVAIPISELERLPACYDADHNQIPHGKVNLGPDLLELTLQDRQFSTKVVVYKLVSFGIQYKKDKKDGSDIIKLKDLVMEEIPAGSI